MTDHRLSDDPVEHFLLSQGIVPTDNARRAAKLALSDPRYHGFVDYLPHEGEPGEEYTYIPTCPCYRCMSRGPA
jgi:hypothetical protein